MGNAQQKTWLLDNVLFLDEASLNEATRPLAYNPVIPAQGAAQGGKAVREERRGAKRHIPSQARLRNLSFNITLDLNGRDVGFVLTCCNDPLALIFCDANGKALREVPKSKISSIEKRDGRSVRVELSDGGDVHASLDLNFTDDKQCNTFVDTVKMMYGIYVHEFGTRPRRANRSTKPGHESTPVRGLHGACPIHGSTVCSCNLHRPAINPTTVQGESSDDGDDGEHDAEEEAVHSSKYPVAIVGNAEPGIPLTFKDLSTGAHRVSVRAVEWFVSQDAGRDPQFPTTPTSSSNDFVLTDRHVGHYIQVRVVRRIKSSSLESQHDFVYSLATKGPCTVNDDTAQRLLKIVCNSPFKVEVQMPHENLAEYFQNASTAMDKPFFEGQLYVQTTGIKIDVGGDDQAPLSIQWQWNNFIPVRAELDADAAVAADDLYLALDAYNMYGQFSRLYLAMPNQKERDCVYHALTFHRLSQDHKGFERWFQDFERGNFSVLKQRYAKLWSGTAWSNYYTLNAPSDVADYSTAAGGGGGGYYAEGAGEYAAGSGYDAATGDAAAAQYQQYTQQQYGEYSAGDGGGGHYANYPQGQYDTTAAAGQQQQYWYDDTGAAAYGNAGPQYNQQQ